MIMYTTSEMRCLTLSVTMLCLKVMSSLRFDLNPVRILLLAAIVEVIIPIELTYRTEQSVGRPVQDELHAAFDYMDISIQEALKPMVNGV